MAKLLISAALVGLLLSGAALAQPDDHRGHGPAPAAHGGPAPAPPQHAGPAPRGAPHAAPAAARPANAPAPRPGAGQQAAPAHPAPRDAMRSAPAGGGSAHGPATAMHGPSGNFASVQRNFNSPHRFHASTYQRPRGWYSHRWTFGEVLPALFWAQGYWIGDYVDYGLMPPPPGTVWVRDGSDALLIDEGDGEIIQVAYGVFY